MCIRDRQKQGVAFRGNVIATPQAGEDLSNLFIYTSHGVTIGSGSVAGIDLRVTNKERFCLLASVGDTTRPDPSVSGPRGQSAGVRGAERGWAILAAAGTESRAV